MGDICLESILGKMLDKEKNKGELKPYLRNINVRWGRFVLDDLLEMRFEESEYVRYALVMVWLSWLASESLDSSASRILVCSLIEQMGTAILASFSPVRCLIVVPVNILSSLRFDAHNSKYICTKEEFIELVKRTRCSAF